MLQCGFVRANLAFPISCGFLRKREHDIRQNAGAGDGNRTHVASLEGWSSTIELHPPEFASSGQAVSRAPYSIRSPLGSWRSRGAGGGGRIRTYVGIRRQIYSLLPLTTRPPLRDRVPPISLRWGPRHAQISASPRFVNTPGTHFRAGSSSAVASVLEPRTPARFGPARIGEE